MIDTKYCHSCWDDFYNGNNDLGVKECWMRESAKLVTRILVRYDQRPPYNGLKRVKVPHCYHREKYATVDPKHLTKDGYWRMS